MPVATSSLRSGRFKRVTAESVESDSGSTTSVAILSSSKIDLVPNATNGNAASVSVPPTNGIATNNVVVHGNLRVLGNLNTDASVQSSVEENTGVTSTSDTRRNHSYSLNAVTLSGKRVTGAASGGNLWITGDTTVSGSSVAVEQVQFIDSRVTTSNPTLALSSATNVSIEDDLILTSTDGDGGKISTSNGPLYLNPANGNVRVNGNLQVDGTLTTVNTTVTNAIVADKTLSLANYRNTLVTYWGFEKDSTLSTTGVAMTLSNATIVAGRMDLTPGVFAFGTASNSATFPKSTDSFEITFNVAFTGVPFTGTRTLFSYGHLIGKWNANGSITINYGSLNVTSVTGPLTMAAGVAKKYQVSIRRVYRSPASLSTFEVFVDTVKCITIVGTDNDTGSIAFLNLITNPLLYLGGDTYSVTLSFDEIRVEKVTPPTNANANGAGIVVEGDAVVNDKKCDRSIVWNQNVAQEAGDNTGSYWQIKGGQLMLTRVIDKTLRKAPGTSIRLSTDIPTRLGTSTEPHLWKLGTCTESAATYRTSDSVSSLHMTFTNTDRWMGAWEFNVDGASGLSNTGFGTGAAFTNPGPTPLNGSLQIPVVAVSNNNQRYAAVSDLNTTGVTNNDGYGIWTVVTRIKTDVSNNSSRFCIFAVGQDATSVGGYMIRLTADSTSIALVVTVGSSENGVSIPVSALSAVALENNRMFAGNPNDGGYHTYRLSRISNSSTASFSDPRQLFQFWYDDLEIPLAIGTNGIVWLGGTALFNTPIQTANAVLRIGNLFRAANSQSITMDYIRIRNGISAPFFPSHPDAAYFETKYGTTGYITSNYGVQGILPTLSRTPLYGVLFTGTVKPVTSLVKATGGVSGAVTTPTTAPFAGPSGSTNTNVNMIEIMTLGNPNSAGAYVSVWVWRDGRIMMHTGTHYNETLNVVVGASEFVIGVHLTSTEAVLYINGTRPAMSGWRLISTNNTSAAITVSLSTAVSDRHLYVGSRTSYVSGEPIDLSFKNWRIVDTSINAMSETHIANTQIYNYYDMYDSAPLTVTYGFRISDDETFQIVKTQGSATTEKFLGAIVPAYDDIYGELKGNVLGTIEDATLNVVSEINNKNV